MNITQIAATTGKYYPIKQKADNKDLRDSIVKAVPGATRQLKGIALRFKGANQTETAKSIFDYLKNEITYVADGESQIVRLPSALMRTKTGDCKSYSLFTAGVLENLGIGYKFVLASYNENPIPQHIYVQTDSGIIIDAVWGKFNSEKQPFYKYYIPMKVGYLTGTDNPALGCADGCGCDNQPMNGWLSDKVDQFKNWVGEQKENIQDANIGDKLKNFAQKAKSVGYAPGRTIFRAMIQTNIDGIATKLAQMNPAAIVSYWEKAGGKKDTILDAINKGKNKTARKMGFLAKLKNKVSTNISGLGAMTDEQLQNAIIAVAPAAGAAIGSAVPGVGTAAGTAGGVSFGAVLIALLPVVTALLEKTSDKSTPEGDGNFYNPDLKSNDFNDFKPEADSFWDKKSVLGIKNSVSIPLGLLLAGGIWYAKKKNYI